jgi:hypothetical protein
MKTNRNNTKNESIEYKQYETKARQKYIELRGK